MKETPNRFSVAQAKAHLSEVLRETENAPAIIHNRGRDVAVILSMHDYQRLTGQAGLPPATRWLVRLADWRRRTGGVDFEAAPMKLRPSEVDFGDRHR